MENQKMREALKAKLKPSGWDRVLSEFIDSPEFEVLMDNLKGESSKMTPSIGSVFNVFYECPYDKLSTVIVNRDPYPEYGEADGFAFSCGKTEVIQPELHVIFQEVQRTCYREEGEDWYAWEPNLKRWANQGVLLLNVNMTTQINKIGSHEGIWKPFIEYLFKKLIDMNTGLVYIFMGQVADDYADAIPENNYKFYCYHPNSSCYRTGDWESNDVFRRTNKILEENNNIKIIW